LTATISNLLPVHIGGSTVPARHFDGKIASVRMWNVEISAGQIITEYNGGVILNTPVQSANLILDTDINNATFSTQWTIPDLTGITAGYTSVNMELGDRVEDCPT